MTSIVETYLDRMVAHDFDAMAQCLAEDVVRVGPYGDTYTPRDTYVAMLAKLMPSLPGYSMEISRVIVKDSLGGGGADRGGRDRGRPPSDTRALVFELNDDGLIAHISIYIQTLPKTPPAVLTGTCARSGMFVRVASCRSGRSPTRNLKHAPMSVRRQIMSTEPAVYGQGQEASRVVLRTGPRRSSP